MTSELKKEPHTPFIPRSFDRITALTAMAKIPRMREPVMAGRAVVSGGKIGHQHNINACKQKAKKVDSKSDMGIIQKQKIVFTVENPD